jgi:hypothetical protein
MKKIIIGLVALTSISAFANSYTCSDKSGPKLDIEFSNDTVSRVTYNYYGLTVTSQSLSGISLTSIEEFRGTAVMNGILFLNVKNEEVLPNDFSAKFAVHTLNQIGMTSFDLECTLKP